MKKPTRTRKQRLVKIRQAQRVLGFAIREEKRRAEKEDLPTAWFDEGLAYLVRLARKAA
jgi:hypothetical protein